MALDSREYAAHLLTFFQELCQRGGAFPVEFFEGLAFSVVHDVANLSHNPPAGISRLRSHPRLVGAHPVLYSITISNPLS